MGILSDKDDDDERPNLADVFEALGVDTYGYPDESYSGWKNVKCCFHDDKRASATVNMALGAYNCNACGVKGDCWKIIMDQLGLDFRAAVDWAAKNVGYEGKKVSVRTVAEPYKPSWLD